MESKRLWEWEDVLFESDLEALHDAGFDDPEEFLSSHEVFDAIVSWSGGIGSGYSIRSLVSRVYGLELGW